MGGNRERLKWSCVFREEIVGSEVEGGRSVLNR